MIGSLFLDERPLPEKLMASRFLSFVTRRTVLAAAPLGVFTGAAARVTLAQPAATNPVSFYLGQVLALATLQAQAVGRLRPLLANPNATDGTWRAAASAEAGVIGAVASVLIVMEPPADLTASVSELRSASSSYRGAADAAQRAASGELAALDMLEIAGARLAQGATSILLWLDALTAETGNDWGDGLRTLTEGSAHLPLLDEVLVATPAETAAEAPVVEEVAREEPVEAEPVNRQPRTRQDRQNRQNQQTEEQPGEESQPNPQNRRNRQNRNDRAAGQ
jgi:hypothetical protein